MNRLQTIIAHRFYRRSGLIPFLLVAVLSAKVCLAQPQDDHAPADAMLRVEGVKIKVPDLSEALAFYRDLLGFGLLSDEHAPATVTLDGGALPVILEHADHPAQAGYPHASQTSLSLQSYDLAATMAHLKTQGVVFLQDPPTPYGLNDEGVPLGLATKLEDPFGNVLSMVEQQVRRGEAFSGVRVYNAGFYLPDTEKARVFYCDQLGFIALTERYYPNIPLGHADRSFAFMLHEVAQIQPAAAMYPETTQLLLVFSTPDLSATLKQLKKRGIILLHEMPQRNAAGRYIALQDPFGNVSEVYEQRKETDL